jgi:hypothetical protein
MKLFLAQFTIAMYTYLCKTFVFRFTRTYLNMLEAAMGKLKSLSSYDERLWIPAIVA